MILTDEDIEGISLSAVSGKDAKADARAVEAAVLAKLASAELPEPALYVPVYRALYTADQLKQYGRDLLEEAAKKCEFGWGNLDGDECAQAIRAMKETI